jgi:hypothetical protein
VQALAGNSTVRYRHRPDASALHGHTQKTAIRPVTFAQHAADAGDGSSRVIQARHR